MRRWCSSILAVTTFYLAFKVRGDGDYSFQTFLEVRNKSIGLVHVAQKRDFLSGSFCAILEK
jgi:hypothetical protein